MSGAGRDDSPAGAGTPGDAASGGSASAASAASPGDAGAGAAPVVIRPAAAGDAPTLGKLGAEMLRLHHAFDPDRFMAPGPHTEEGYGRFLAAERENDDTLVLVAERAGEILGYVFAGVEPRSWKELRDVAGFVHDVLVVEPARGGGIGARLVEAAAEWLVARGMPRVMLWTAAKNAAAQRLFERLGFRRTMIEMTRER